MVNAILLLSMTLMVLKAQAAQKGLNEVIEERVQGTKNHVRDLETVASRERVRAWLPTSPTISYSSNDNYSWKAWSLSTNLPFPFKPLYRDKIETAKINHLKATANLSKQEILRSTVEIYLGCSIPSEMTQLLEESLNDQKLMTSISTSLYASGSVPQADRVASELQLRQIEAQVQMQRDLAIDGCRRWSHWSSEDAPQEEITYKVMSDISDETLKKIDLVSDVKKDVFKRKLEEITISKDKLWSKFIPDLELNVSRNNYFDPVLSGGPPVKYTYSWSVGITLPFSFPFYDNTEFRRESAELGLEKIQTEIERSASEKNWEQAKKDWKRTKLRLEEIARKDMSLAEAFVESSMASYRSGKIGFADLVLARRTKLDLKIEEINLKAQKLLAKTVCLTECEL